jgi:hypothetical protein
MAILTQVPGPQNLDCGLYFFLSQSHLRNLDSVHYLAPTTHF